MNILHILSNDKDKTSENTMIEFINQNDIFKHIIIIKTINDDTIKYIEKSNIQLIKLKFSGIFDLTSPSDINKIVNEESINCINIYNDDSKKYLKNIKSSQIILIDPTMLRGRT